MIPRRTQDLDRLLYLTFANRYLALIQGWEIAPNGNEPAPIRCGEAEGLLMPMRME